jgi:hypothetical protein
MREKQRIISQTMWNLPEEIERFVASKCPKGTSLTCLICSKWDEERSSKNYGTINCRPEHPFGYSLFNELLKSTRHGNNVKKRDTFKSENERREKLGLPVKKKQRIQSLLAFATKKPTKEQVHNRVSKGNVPLSVACGNNKSLEEEILLNQERVFEIVNGLEANSNDHKSPVLPCCGIIAKKDLADDKVQQGLQMTKRYCGGEDGILKSIKIKEVLGMTKIMSVFADSCSGSSECVR